MGAFDDFLGGSQTQPSQAPGGSFDDYLKSEPGDTMRGLTRSVVQIPEFAYGAGALAAMSAEKLFGEGGLSTAAKDYFAEKYTAKAAENQKYAPSVEFTDAWENLKAGDLGSMADWLQDTAGYVVGQGLQTLVTGGIGALGGKAVLAGATEKMLGSYVANQAAKIAEASVVKEGMTEAARQAAVKAALPEATNLAASRTAQAIGAGVVLSGQNLGMEAGDIYGGLTEEAAKTGKEITGDDLLRAWAMAAAAAGTETATDLLGLGAVTGRLKIGGKSMQEMTGVGGRAARGATAAAIGVPIEGGQEYAQTYLEQVGAGKDTDTDEARKERINAAAVGAVGGGVMGGGIGLISGARPAQPDAPLASDVTPSATPGGPPADEPTPTTDDLVSNISNSDVGLDEFIADTARATGTLQTGGLIGSDTGRAIGENAAALPDQELTDFIQSEERDKEFRQAEIDRANQPAIAGGTMPEAPGPTAMEMAFRTQAEREAADAASAQQEVAKAEQDRQAEVRTRWQAAKDEREAALLARKAQAAPEAPATFEQVTLAGKPITEASDKLLQLALRGPKAEIAKAEIERRATSGSQPASAPGEPAVGAPAESAVPGRAAVEPKQEFASTQTPLPDPISARVKGIAKILIDPADVDLEHGLDDRPHITVKYGLHTADVEGVRKLVEGEPPARAKVAGIEIFSPDGKDYDVVVARVDSPDLARLNKKISDALPNTQTQPGYKPHITLGYVKRGLGEKYADAKTGLEGTEITLDTIEVSDQNENLTPIKLAGQPVARATATSPAAGAPQQAPVEPAPAPAVPVAEPSQPPVSALRQHVEALIKRKSAANQIGKDRAFNAALALAKDALAGETVNVNRFTMYAKGLAGDQPSVDALNGIVAALKEPTSGIVPRRTITDIQYGSTETKGTQNAQGQMQPVREDSGQNTTKALQDVSRRLYAELEKVSPADFGTGKEGQLQELRGRISKAGETPEAAVRAMWGPQLANASPGLRQAIARGLAMPTVPSGRAQENNIEGGKTGPIEAAPVTEAANVVETSKPAAPAQPIRIFGQLLPDMTVAQLQHAVKNAAGNDWKAAAATELKKRDQAGESFMGKTVDQLNDKQLALIAAGHKSKTLKAAAQAEISARGEASALVAERLKQPGIPDLMTALAEDAGWAERGGFLIRRKTGEAAGEEVISRTKWIPRAEWWPGRPVAENEQFYRTAVAKAIAGATLTGKQAKAVAFMLDLAEHEAGIQVEPDTSQADIASVQPAVDDAGPAPSNWPTMTKEQQDEELDSLFGEPAKTPEAARAQAGAGEVGSAEQKRAAYNSDQQGFELAPKPATSDFALSRTEPDGAKLWHVSSPKNRQSIASDGLRTSDMGIVFLSPSKEMSEQASKRLGFDLWEINAGGIKTFDDPLHPGFDGSRSTREAVKADRLSLVAKAGPIELTGETNADIAAAEKAAKDARAAAEAATKAAHALDKAVKDRAAIKEASAKADFNLTGTEPVTPKDQRAIDAKAAADQLAGQGSMFQARPAYGAPWYYSELARQIETSKQNAAPAAMWKGLIANLKGVKADEIEASGVIDWLSAMPGNQKVTREDLLAFIAKGGLQIQDVVLGGQRYDPELEKRVKDLKRELLIYRDDSENVYGDDRSQWPEEVRAKQADINTRLTSAINERDDSADSRKPQFATYQLPGGKDYREAFITLPEMPVTGVPVTKLPNGYDLVEDRNNPPDRRWLVTPPGQMHGQPFAGEHPTQEAAAAEAIEKINSRLDSRDSRLAKIQTEMEVLSRDRDPRTNVMRNERRWFDLANERDALSAQNDNWSDGHGPYSDIKNPIMRYRSSEFTDADGRKGLLVHEMQPPLEAEFKKMPAYLQKNWMQMGLKRIIRDAAERNLEFVAFSTGEQQVKMYEGALRKAVDSIEWTKTPEGVHLVGYKGTNADYRNIRIPELEHMVEAGIATRIQENELRRLMAERNGNIRASANKVADTRYAENDLTAAIGKVMADRIRNDPNQKGTIEGEGLTIDSVGLKNLYDKTLPSVANEVLRKLGGGRVGEVTIPLDEHIDSKLSQAEESRWRELNGMNNRTEFDRGRNRVAWEEYQALNDKRRSGQEWIEKGSQQPALTITPAMRETVMQGQSLFQPRQAYNPNQAEIIYDNTPIRPGTTGEQRATGIASIRGWLGVADRLASRDGNAIRGQAAVQSTILGNAMWNDIQEHGGTELIGKRAGSANEFALVSQILRDPRWETMRVAFVKAGIVVGHTGWTTRKAGSVTFAIEGSHLQRYPATATKLRLALLKHEMAGHKADGYYLLHNHPNGRAIPSPEDVRMTATVSREMRGFLGHVIIDHDEYSVIGKDLMHKLHKLPATPARAPQIAHDLLGKRIANFSHVAEAARMLQTKTGYATLIATNGIGEIQALAEVPEALLVGGDRLFSQFKAVVRINRFMEGTGSAGGAFIVADNPERFDWLIARGALTDAVSSDGKVDRSRFVKQGPELRRPSKTVLAARQMAWHGSPYTFDQFKLQHIGTGEGAQAYGWGMYFSQARDVAQYYKDGLTNKGRPPTIQTNIENAAWNVVRNAPEKTDAQLLQFVKKPFADGSVSNAEAYEAIKTARAALQRGKLYQVELAPKESDYLDWDKPLSEQSEKVRAALKNVGYKPDSPDVTGSQIYMDLGFQFADKSLKDDVTDQEKASRYLNSIGIPGIKYLDQSSRDVGRIWEEGGKWFGTPADTKVLKQFGNDEKAAQAWSAEEQKKQSHNYVIFDDSHVSITGVEQPRPQYGQDQTQTPEFRAWFGDSVVTDTGKPGGKPLVVYHGTNQDVTSFDNNTVRARMPRDAIGFYFTKYSKDAAGYASMWKAPGQKEGAPNIVPVYLNLRNPLRTTKDDLRHVLIFPKEMEKLKAQGYDGAIYNDGEEIVSFRPEQIKSAIGNRGTFDPASANILEQPAPPYNVASNSVTERLKQAIPQLTRDRIREWVDIKLYNYQNMFNMLPRIQQRLQPGVLPEGMDANLAVEAYPKKVAAQIDDFHDDTVKPFVKLLHDNNLTIDQAQDYVNAKDAPDRNREMKARNPTAPELDALKADLAAQRDALANDENVKDFIAKRRELRQAEADVEDGIADDSLVTMTKAEITALRKETSVRNYAQVIDKIRAMQGIKPFEGDNTALSGKSDAEAGEIIAKAKQDGTYAALERVSAAVDAITASTRKIFVDSGLEKPEVIAAWEAAYPHYVPRFRDEVTSGFDHPIGQGFQVRGKESKRATGSTKEATNILAHVMAQHEAAIIRANKVVPDRALFALLKASPGNDVAELDVAPTVRDVDAKTGLVIERVDPLYKNKPNVLTLKIDGDEHTITFNEDNPEALRLAAALKNLSAQDIGEITALVGQFTRFLAAMNTAANPVFGLRNFIRDSGTAFVNLSDTELADHKAEVYTNMPKAIRGMWDMVRGKMDSEWAKSAREFRDAGGVTGFVQNYKDIGQRAESLEKQLADMKPGKVNFTKETAVKYWHLIQDANIAVENGIRLSAYVAARKIDMSQAKAISLSNNLTVNFNKRGIKGAELNMWYMFMNASIQGTARLVKAMGNRNVQKIIGYVILSAFLLDLLNRGLAGDGDDDGENDYDQLPDYTKANNFVFWFGRPITIPMPYGYNFFASVGRMMGEAMFRKNYSPGKSAVNLATVFLDAFSPMGQSGDLLQFAAPTIADPFVQWAENKNFAGNPLRKEQLPFGPPKPESQMGFKSTSAPAKALTEVLNDWTGGNEVRPGLINMNPVVFDFAVTAILGGAGRTYLQTASLPIKAAMGDEIQAREIPFANVFASAKPEYQIERKFIENLRAVQTVKEELKHYAGDPGQLRSIREDHAAEIKLIGSAQMMQNVLEGIRKQERLIEKNRPHGWRDQEKALEDRKKVIMSGFNKRFSEVRAQ